MGHSDTIWLLIEYDVKFGVEYWRFCSELYRNRGLTDFCLAVHPVLVLTLLILRKSHTSLNTVLYFALLTCDASGADLVLYVKF